MEQQLGDGKPIVHYPCSWLYKLIGMDRERIRCAIIEITAGRDCSVTFSNSSGSGKYHCLNLEIMVYDEEERNRMYVAFKRHSAVKIVL